MPRPLRGSRSINHNKKRPPDCLLLYMRPRRVFPGSVWAGWWWKGWKHGKEQAEGVSALTRLRSSWGDTRWPRKHDAAKSDQGPAGRGPSRDLQPRQEEGAGRGQTGQWWGSRQGPRAEGRAGWPQGGAERGGRRSGKSVPALKAPGLMPSQVRAHPRRELPDCGECVSPQRAQNPLGNCLSNCCGGEITGNQSPPKYKQCLSP